MDQGTLWDTQENRNDPLYQRGSPCHPRLPCKLWVRRGKGKAVREGIGVAAQSVTRDIGRRGERG